MDMRAEDMLPMASAFKQSLNLNANQQTLWQQVESREALQDKAKTLLAKPEARPAGEHGGGKAGERGGRCMGGHGRGGMGGTDGMGGGAGGINIGG